MHSILVPRVLRSCCDAHARNNDYLHKRFTKFNGIWTNLYLFERYDSGLIVFGTIMCRSFIDDTFALPKRVVIDHRDINYCKWRFR